MRNLEETLIDKVNEAKSATQKKLFNEFVKTKEQNHRDEIGYKMDVLDKVTFELIKEVRKSIT